MKKLLGLTLCVMFVLLTFASSVYATTYDYDSFFAQKQYGSKSKVSDNITNLKGSEEANGMCWGPMSTKSTAKLADGITEEVYIDLDLEKFKTTELFEITLALKADVDGVDTYAHEQVIRTQKTGDNEFTLQANGTPFNLKVTESGIYTYRWNMYTEDGVTYVKFSLYNGNELVGTTGIVNMDNIEAPETLRPLAQQKDVGVYHLWFCNIKAENGVNVYAELPKTEEPTNPEPTNPEPANPEPANPDTTTPEPTNPETPAEQDETPKTGSIDVALVASMVSLVSLAGVVAVKKYSK